jgi:hypothetical protein
MAKRRRSLPPPPGRGGYEFEVAELGPMIYYGTPPVPIAKVKLIGGSRADGAATRNDPSVTPEGPPPVATDGPESA